MTTTTRSNRTRAAVQTTLLAAAVVTFMTGCGDDGKPKDDDQIAYCTDKDGKVLPEDYCDDNDSDGHGGGFIFIGNLGGFGGNRYSTGQVIPQQYRSAPSVRSFPASDQAARAAAGLPKTGPVVSGTRISGGIGTGKAGGAGSVGGAKGGGSTGG